MTTQRRQTLILAALGALALGALLGAPFIGMHRLSLAAVMEGPSGGGPGAIFWRLRMPRVLLAFVAGSALAASGMAFQAMFRNPLATPYTLGVSSGASLGAVLYLRLGLGLTLGWFSGVAVFSFGGALGAILLVYGLTRARRGFSTATMLLAGIAIGMFCSSLIMFLQFMSDFTQSFRILRWLMGSVETVGYGAVLNTALFVAPGCVILACLTREMNLLTVGDDVAMGRGVNVRGVKQTLFVATSLMVGGVVSACGPIAFIGMMAPHICRLLIGPNHRVLLPASLLFGGAFLTVCDTAARTVLAPAELPVGVVTALLGGPFFVWLLLSESVTSDQ